MTTVRIGTRATVIYDDDLASLAAVEEQKALQAEAKAAEPSEEEEPDEQPVP